MWDRYICAFVGRRSFTGALHAQESVLHYLITGGAGFIGSHLADALVERGDNVTVIDDLSTGSMRNIARLKDNPRFTCVIASMMNAPLLGELVAKADRIFHLAAAVGVKLVVESPVRTIETNVGCTELALAAACRYHKKILIASTSEVYGKSNRLPFREDGDLVLGPSQTGRYGMVVPRFVGQALRGEPITVYGDGQQSRCLTHVSDAVRAAIGLMDSDRTVGEVFNVGSDQEIRILELAERVRSLTESESEIVFVPFQQAYGDDFEDMPRRVPSLERVRKAIAYEPRVGLDETLRSVIAYHRSREPTLA